MSAFEHTLKRASRVVPVSQVRGGDSSAADVHRDVAAPAARERHDRRRLERGRRHHVPAAVRLARAGAGEPDRSVHPHAGPRLCRLLRARLILPTAGRPTTLRPFQQHFYRAMLCMRGTI